MTAAETVAHLHAAMLRDFRILGILFSLVIALLLYIAIVVSGRR